MKMKLVAALALSLAGIAAPSAARAEDPLFATSDQLQLTIKAPLNGLIRNRDNDSPVAGVMIDPHGQSLPVTIALRGLTRRTADICDFPPLRVTFPSPPPPTSVFAGQKRLKLVTHCKNSSGFQQHVLLEYAAYKLYNVLTPRSTRVRLANINYQDSDGRPIITRVGFFIEDLDDVAKRNGMKDVKAGERIPVNWLVPADAARFAMFEYMISNYDWSMRAGPPGDKCCHNGQLIGGAGPGMTIPVPYDFDYSGLVNAPYALPPEQFGLSNVRQRLYRGYCIHNADALAVARQMRALRPQLLGALNTPGMSAGTLSSATAYLEKFFADIATDDSVGVKILKRCVG